MLLNPCYFAFILLALIQTILSSRILLMPFPWVDHIGNFKILGDALNAKGHQVHMVLPSHHPEVSVLKKNGSRINPVSYTAKHRDFLTFTEDESNITFEEMIKMTQIQEYRTSSKGFVEICYNILEDEILDDKIQDLNIDIAIVDAIPYTRCYYVLLYRLGIQYISLLDNPDPWLSRSPALPSFVPFQFVHPPLTPDMTFWQRLVNFWTLLDWTSSMHKIPYMSNDLVQKYAINRTAVTINQLARWSLLWMIQTDILLDYPRPLMPNEIYVGGLTTEPAKNVTKNLDSFISQSTDGVILLSFGSHPVMPQIHMMKIIDSLKKLPIKTRIIIEWPYEGKLEVPSNMLQVDSLSRNDVLAHSKLFITHGSSEAQFEAMYHGVPMLNIPIFGEQLYNAKRTDYRGFSETLCIDSLKHTHNIVNRMLRDISYSRKIKKASELFRARKITPKDYAVQWIEQVLQFGASHLYSNAVDLPSYKYLMLDIFVFIAVILIACVWIVSNTLLLCIKRFQYARMEMKSSNGVIQDVNYYQNNKTLAERKKSK